MARLVAFPYYGGKNSHLSWLLPLLPTAKDITHYCEPFGGSAAVLLNREPCSVETYNDLDKRVVNFFRVLRDNPGELLRMLALTPYSRAEFTTSTHDNDVLSDMERARRFYVYIRQGFGAKMEGSNWSYCKGGSSRGMSSNVSAWWSGIDKLTKVAQRLLRVQIENDGATEVIERYDSPETLFYCDPPYYGAEQVYRHMYSNEAHKELAVVLNSIDGFAAVSGYACEELDELYPPPLWSCVNADGKVSHMSRGLTRIADESNIRVESLYVNYKLLDGEEND